MVLKRIKEEQAKLRKEIKERTISYILAGLGVVAGFAWNEAIRSLVDIFPRSANDPLFKFIYAVVVTIIIVIISVYLARLVAKKEETNN